MRRSTIPLTSRLSLSILSLPAPPPRVRRHGKGLYHLQRQALGNLERRIQRYTTRDVVDAFVDSTIFVVPLLVEGGVFDVGAHSASALVSGVPVYFLANVAFVATVTDGMLYYAGFREVEVTDSFGVVPRRLAGC